MKQTLGGSLFVFNSISQDYCLSEAVASLKYLCDNVVILDAGSDDGTADMVKSFEDEKTQVILLPNSMWHSQQGREKLSYFTNIAINALDMDWNINLQADEAIHEGCFDTIRKAIEEPNAEGYWVSRINLWGNSQHYLDVPDERKPVGDKIIRLCKTKYQSIDDAQSIHCPNADWKFVDDIKIYHMGFIRNKYIHCKKIKHMLVDVFQMGENDKKVDAMEGVFDPWVHFSKEDVKPIQEPLPVFVQEWAKKRDEINNVII